MHVLQDSTWRKILKTQSELNKPQAKAREAAAGARGPPVSPEPGRWCVPIHPLPSRAPHPGRKQRGRQAVFCLALACSAPAASPRRLGLGLRLRLPPPRLIVSHPTPPPCCLRFCQRAPHHHPEKKFPQFRSIPRASGSALIEVRPLESAR